VSAKKLHGMDSLADRLRAMVLYPLSYVSWHLGITSVLEDLGRKRPGVIVLTFHRVNEEAGAAAGGYDGNVIPLKRFRQFLAYLKARHQFISPDELMTFVRGDSAVTRPSLLLTFDDGYEDICRFALPLIRDEGIPSVVFVTTGILQEGFVFPADKPSPGDGQRRLYMTALEVQAIKAMGFEIGSHSVSHPVLAELSSEQQKREIVDSRNQLEELTGAPVRFFSYPIGPISPETPGFVREAGYQMALGNRRSAVQPGGNRYFVPRVSTGNQPLPVLAFKLAFLSLMSRRRAQ